MFTSPALIDRPLDDVVTMIKSAARGDRLEMMELLSVEALVDERALALFGDTTTATAAAGIVVGAAALARTVAELDVALTIVHAWLATSSQNDLVMAGARLQRLIEDAEDAREMANQGYLPVDHFHAAVAAMNHHRRVTSLYLTIAGVALEMLPYEHGVATMTVAGATLGHVAFDDAVHPARGNALDVRPA
jgi:hypothetical protein